MEFNGGKTLSFSIKENMEDNILSECCVCVFFFLLPIVLQVNEKKRNKNKKE